jgi:hypothetical protein
MAFTAQFDFAENEQGTRAVLSCQIPFYQTVDSVGRPNSKVTGGFAFVLLDMTNDPAMVNWQLDPYKVMPWASLKFMRIDQESVLKEVHMEDVCCMQFTERKTRAQGSHVMLTLSARVITVNNVRHENNWEG